MGDPFAGYNNADNILKKGENVQDKINKNLFIKAEPNKTSCFVGEPVVVSYNIYTRLETQSAITKTPAFDGFSMVDLSQPGNANTTEKIVKLNGKEYHVYTLMKVQLYPLQPGQFSVGTVETENTVHFIKEAYAAKADDIFQPLPPTAMVDQKISLKNKPVFITVKPLPEINKPASFKGAVGNFKLSAVLDKDSFSTDDAGKLSVTITGAGNMILINAPAIQWPNSIESFEPKQTDTLDKTQVPITGSKHFNYTFTVQNPGRYTIPPVTMSFFDPKTADYKTVATTPLSVTVTQGTKRIDTATIAPIAANNDKGILSTLSDIPYLPFELAALIIILGLLFWFNRSKNKSTTDITEQKIPEQPITAAEPEQSKSHLALSEEKLQQHDSKGFYEALNKEIRVFLSAYFHILPEEINKKRIAEEMDKKGISFAISIKMQQLMEDIEWQLYSPLHTNPHLEESFSNAEEIIYSLESIAR
jgi:hypothetical protein